MSHTPEVKYRYVFWAYNLAIPPVGNPYKVKEDEYSLELTFFWEPIIALKILSCPTFGSIFRLSLAKIMAILFKQSNPP